MPILPKQPNLFPENLLDNVEGSESDRKWWVLYALPRQEKALARDLHSWKIPYFFPQVAQERLMGRKKVKSYLPLFSGYVFMKASEDERAQTYSTKRVSSYLPVADPERLTEDLRNLNELIESDAPLTIESKLEAGQLVRVRAGSLKGIEGMIIRRSKKKRLLVSVDYLQQGVSVEIDDYMVEPI